MMPLKYKKEPSKVKEIVTNQLGKMASKKAFRTPVLAKIQLTGGVPQTTPDQAVPVYHLGLDDLKQNGDISSAEQRSWRYLVKHDDEVVATADAVIGGDGEPVFSHVNEGPLVTGIISALNVADSIGELEDGDYEVRLLMVPALYVAALWFVDSTGGQDYAMPIEPTSGPLNVNELITIQQLMEKLQDLASAHPD
ncbi:MAG: hypothetical protein NWE89_07770 [Candidatus Bathyarchaeota archaeon]|nr:hypothetical protein [Candidatus Bathyarchaeota archaeon]